MISYVVSIGLTVLIIVAVGVAVVCWKKILYAIITDGVLNIDQIADGFYRWISANEIAALLTLSIWCAVVLWYLYTKFGVSIQNLIGCQRGKFISQLLVGGVVGFLCKLLVTPLYLGSVDVLNKLMNKSLFPAMIEQLQASGGCLKGRQLTFLSVLVIVVIAPIVEEIIFRGLLYSSLRSRFRVGVSVLISSAAFSIGHVNLIAIPVTMITGVVLAFLYEKQKTLIGPMSAHVCINALAVFYSRSI